MTSSQPSAGPQRKGSAILPFTAAKGSPRSSDLCGSPRLVLNLGRDRHSSGVSIWIATPSGSVWPHTRLILGERWNHPLPGEEGILEIAIQALQTALGELRGLTTD